MIVEYERAGGLAPADDERLVVDDDGAYELVRTVGTARVGRFRGTVPDDELAMLRPAVTAAGAEGDLDVASTDPDSAREQLRVEGAVARLGDHDQPDGAWGDVVRSARRLLDSLATTAAHQDGLLLKANRTAAQVQAVGNGRLELDPGRIGLTAVAVGPDGGTLDRLDRAPGRDTAMAVLDSGWLQVVDFDRRFELPDGGVLRVTLTIPGRRDGRLVTYRLFTPVR